jgi:hypothetical protein
MGRVFNKLFAMVFTSPITLLMVGWVLLVAAIASATSLFLVGAIFWCVVGIAQGFAEWSHALVLPVAAAVSLLCWYVTWASGRATWVLCVELVDDVRQVRDTTREVITERAERAEAKAAHGGRLSMSEDADVGGELTQAAPEASGLELVDEVALGLDEEEVGVGEGAAHEQRA